ncbi:hypothetical protein [Neisseria elongata]|uniref:hypothetical protein n=1 Tax=Neisseria elongata TaxID=495 RepID=UPI002D7836F0|nr:hypothetical protein [Neisseria elongata]
MFTTRLGTASPRPFSGRDITQSPTFNSSIGVQPSSVSTKVPLIKQPMLEDRMFSTSHWSFNSFMFSPEIVCFGFSVWENGRKAACRMRYFSDGLLAV